MRKGLTKLFSLLLTAVLTFSVSAQPLARKAGGSGLSKVKATDLAKRAPSKTKGQRALGFPKVRSHKANANKFPRKALRTAKLPLTSFNKAPLKEATGIPEIWGSVTFSDSWTQDNAPVGLYTVPTGDSQQFDLLFEGPSANYGGVLLDGVYYSCRVFSFWGMVIGATFEGYDIESGEQVYNAEASYYTSTMALDPSTNTAYGISNIEGTQALVSLEFATLPELTPVCALQLDGTSGINSIAIDKTGKVYAIVVNYEPVGEDYIPVSSTLCTIDKATGELTEIGDTGEIPMYTTDSTIDPASGRMFWTLCPSDETGWFCEVDLSTGAASRLYHFPDNDEVVGLVIPAAPAENKAPAAATDLSASFEKGSLSGTVSFMTPATLFDGTPGEGEISYSILANGMEVASGKTGFNESVSANVTLLNPGLYTFVVTLSNEAGSSPKAKIANIYVGKDTPAATTATLEYADGNMNLSWLPVTASINGGYLNADAVTYSVKRYPGNVEVASGIKVTSFSEPISEPETITSYYYTVTAECEGLVSAEAVSNVVVLGSYTPPYASDFASEGLAGYTVIDSNNDGKIWYISDGVAKIDYNSSMAMDDWLVTPPMAVEAGKAYKVSAAVYGSSTYTERMEVRWGYGPNAADMTNVLIAPTEIQTPSANPIDLSAYIVPDAKGNIFIGYHCISDADQYFLCISEISVSAPTSTEAPAAVEGLKVVAGDNGARNATVSFTTPSKTIGGSDLQSLSKVEILRDNELVGTIDNPATGTELSYTDALAEPGTYTYSVVAFNAEGSSDVVSANVFVGIDYPGDLVAPRIVETSNPGEVTISWDAITETADGLPLDPANVTYQIYEIDGYSRYPITEKLSATSYTFQAVPEGEQEFVQYAVFPYTERGEGAGDYTDMIPAGTPYDSYSMTCDEDLDEYILGYSTSGEAQLSIGSDETFADIQAIDGDDFYLLVQGQYLDDSVTMFTGNVSLESMVNPGFSLYTFNVAEENINTIQISVRESGAEDSDIVFDSTVEETGPIGWNKIMVNLADYAGKTIQVSITATVNKYAAIPIDAIKIGSMLDYDLGIQSISAPAKVNAGNDYSVDVTVSNDGVKEAAEFTVELYADSELADSKVFNGLKSGMSETIRFDRSFSAIATEPVVYFAKVVYAADENEANNQSMNVTVVPAVSKLPVATDLEGESVEAGIALAWSEPNLEAASGDPVTEDFEDAESFSNIYGNWTFVDVDKSEVGGFQNMDVPGITPGETLGSFWIWDSSMVGNQSFGAHSGDKYLFSLFRYDDGQADDWAISPMLDGCEQTISFWAKSYSAQYPEAIEVYTSEGSVDPADFSFVAGSAVAKVPGEWTEYQITLPEGTKRFAIRSCAASSFMLMVDDVTYIPADAVADLSIVGYNVYRDGVKINEAPVAETEFVDTNCQKGVTYRYAVTTVFTKGESAASNYVDVMFGSVGVGSMNAGVKVVAERQNIVITGAEGRSVAVYAADGRTVFSGIAGAKTEIPAASGVYAVKAGKTVVKVIVK